MKKLAFVLILNLISSFGLTTSLNYKCFGIDDNGPYSLKMIGMSVVAPNQIKMDLAVLKRVLETYILDHHYIPKNKSMKNYFKYDVINPHYQAYGEGQ